MRQKVTISGASVGALELGALDAVVTDLAASGLPSVVGGMLGLDFLTRFELVLDLADRAMRLHPSGAVATGGVLVPSPAPHGTQDGVVQAERLQPFPGSWTWVRSSRCATGWRARRRAETPSSTPP